MTAEAPLVESPSKLPHLSVQVLGDGVVRFELGGRLESLHIHEVWKCGSHTLASIKPARLIIDAGEVTYCDSTAATMLHEFRAVQRAADHDFELQDFPTEFESVLQLLDRFKPDLEPIPPRIDFLEHLGRSACSFLRDSGDLVAAIGEIVVALWRSLLKPHRIRWQETARAAQTAGVNSLPVIVLVTGLLGVIMGFQSAQTLSQYGGDLLLANLIGLSFLRELGPLMTAVVLTARSGSAFAAEIGTMKINEEVDALDTMGVHSVRFLVVPRVIAAVVLTPLLTVVADLAGLGGGLFVWIFTLDLSFPAYVAQLEGAIQLSDFLTGLFKATVFGVLVAGIGCIRGMQTKGSASAVGDSTTSAVVSGIVLITLGDAVFTIIFHHLEL